MFKCKRCGRTFKAPQGAAAHLPAHGMSAPLSDHLDLFEFEAGQVNNGTVPVLSPTVIPHPTPMIPTRVRVVDDEPITRVKNMEVVRSGSKIGIVEWHDGHGDGGDDG